MPIFTRYKLSGEVVESRFIDSDEITQHKYSILGQKARITTVSYTHLRAHET